MRNFSTPSPAQQGAIKRLGQSSDGQFLKQYLLENLSETDKDNRSAAEVSLYRSQGKALTLKAILDLLEAK